MITLFGSKCPFLGFGGSGSAALHQILWRGVATKNGSGRRLSRSIPHDIRRGVYKSTTTSRRHVGVWSRERPPRSLSEIDSAWRFGRGQTGTFPCANVPESGTL